MTNTANDKQGLLLVGHGTRDPLGRAEFLQTVALVRERCGGVPVECGFLELAEPTIGAGVEAFVRRGVSQIIAAPVLLFAAGHAKEDIPRELASAANRFPGVGVCQARPLECHPAILELSAERFRAALATTADESQNCRATDSTLWILVGRGSSDPEAIAKVHEFAVARRQLTPVSQVAVAFVAAAQPRLPQTLVEAATSLAERIVVQPHLLFHGEVLHEIRNQVSAIAERFPAKQWLVTDHLGVSQKVVEAILDLAKKCGLGN